MLRNFFALILACSIWACNPPKEKNSVIENNVLLPNTPLAPLFDSLRPPTQTYSVSGEKDTLLLSKDGIFLSFTKNTFLNDQGQPARNVTISLVEAMSLADIIQSNLQTTSDDKILMTAGMFFIDAKEDGKPLTIAEGKSIYIELSTPYKSPEMTFFNGKFNDDGKINWLEKSGMEKLLIPIPINLLKFDGFYEENEGTCYLSPKQIKSIAKPKFENTFIATREFEERSFYLASCVVEEERQGEKDLLDIYTSNLDKPLFYSDSLVLLWLSKEYKLIDTTKQENWNSYWVKSRYRMFTAFVKQHLTNVINFEKLEVNSRTTVEQLKAKGHSSMDAEKYVALFKARTQVLKDRKVLLKELRKREEEWKKQQKEGERIKQSILKLSAYSFSISKLGWVNVDQFLDDARSQESTFVVQNSSKDSLGLIDASLIIPNYRVAISSVHNQGNQYSFTDKGGNYRKLPVGESAIVFAFSYKAGKPYFGSKSITIPKEGKVELSLNQMSERQIKKEIAKLLE